MISFELNHILLSSGVLSESPDLMYSYSVFGVLRLPLRALYLPVMEEKRGYAFCICPWVSSCFHALFYGTSDAPLVAKIFV